MYKRPKIPNLNEVNKNIQDHYDKLDETLKVLCPTCEGTGRVKDPRKIMDTIPCLTCSLSGWITINKYKYLKQVLKSEE